MRRDEVSGQLSQTAFEFFFQFSRFEAALKENQFLNSNKPGDRAEPNWRAFSAAFAEKYVQTPAAKKLVELAPETQIVGNSGDLEWKATKTDWCKSELERVIVLLRTVRNNLFHGAKHGSMTWDNPARTTELLAASRTVLDELADLAGFSEDYERRY